MAATGTCCPVTGLFDAIAYGDAGAVATILNAHPDIVNIRHETKNGWGMCTPLMEACAGYYLYAQVRCEIVDCLLERGADVNATGYMLRFHSLNNLGQPKSLCRPFNCIHNGLGVFDDLFPLYVAVEHDSEYTINVLLQEGADVNQKTAKGETALHHACRAWDRTDDYDDYGLDHGPSSINSPTQNIVKTLIDHGSDVNCQDDYGMTPLHHACKSRRHLTAGTLLERGADISIKDSRNRTPLEYAALQSYKTMQVLLKRRKTVSHQARIEAYEMGALTYQCPDAYQSLLKAMRLRRKYEIPKVVEEPQKCYNYIKEYETVKELRQIENNEPLLTIHALLARERILKDKGYDLLKDNDRDVYMKSGLTDWNALQLHHVKLLEKSGQYVEYGDSFNYTNHILSRLSHPTLSMKTDVVMATTQLLLRGLSKIQEDLYNVKKIGLEVQLISQFKVNLLYINYLICMLLLRSELPKEGYPPGSCSTPDKDLYLMTEIFVMLTKRFKGLESPNSSFKAPLPHLIFDRSCFRSWLFEYDKYYVLLLKMFLKYNFDVDATDSDGNSLLHVVASSMPDPVLIFVLLDDGAHCHNRNKYRETALDLVKNSPLDDKHKPQVLHMLEESKFMKILSLQCIAAIKIRDEQITYKDYESLPRHLIEFVDKH